MDVTAERYVDKQIPENAITAIKEALAQPEQDGKCKYCTDGCPACDARKLPEQEPVVWAKFSAKGNIIDLLNVIDLLNEPDDDDYTPLYSTPPQRTWIGLTGELGDGGDPMFHCGAKWAERKLKEKNS